MTGGLEEHDPAGRRRAARRARPGSWSAATSGTTARPHCSAAPDATRSQRSPREPCRAGRAAASVRNVTTGQISATPSSVAFCTTSSIRSPLRGDTASTRRSGDSGRGERRPRPRRAETVRRDTSSRTASNSRAGAVEDPDGRTGAKPQHLAGVVGRVLGQRDARSRRGARARGSGEGRSPHALVDEGAPTLRRRRSDGACRRRRRPRGRTGVVDQQAREHERAARGEQGADLGGAVDEQQGHQVREDEVERAGAQAPAAVGAHDPQAGAVEARVVARGGGGLGVDVGSEDRSGPEPRRRRWRAAPCPRRGRGSGRAAAGRRGPRARRGRGAWSRGCRSRRPVPGSTTSGVRGRPPAARPRAAPRRSARRGRPRKPSRKRATQSTSGTSAGSTAAPGGRRRRSRAGARRRRSTRGARAAPRAGTHLDAHGPGFPERATVARSSSVGGDGHAPGAHAGAPGLSPGGPSSARGGTCPCR